MFRTTTLAALICLSTSQLATAQYSGLGGHRYQGLQNGIAALQGGRVSGGGHGRPMPGGSGLGGIGGLGGLGGLGGGGYDRDDIRKVVGGVILSKILSEGLKHPQPKSDPWPRRTWPQPQPTWPQPTWPPVDRGPTITYGGGYPPSWPTRPTRRPETPVQTSPVQTSPVQTSPVQTSPVQTPVQTAPVPTTPIVNIKPPATDPRANELPFSGRPLTQAEIQRAREHFQRRLNELTQSVGCRLPKIDVNMQELMSLMIAQAIAAEIQIRIWDAIRSGDCDAAQQLWVLHCPGVKPPFCRSRIWGCFTTFCTRLEAGTCTPRDGQDMEQELIACGLAEHPCCGAPSLLEEIQECLTISQAVARAQPGVQTQAAPVPAGSVDIVYHPGLPDGDTIVLDTQTVMLGTGGVGTMHVQHGNVAQQQGYPLGTGVCLDESQAPLVKSGILIENPTQTEVQFVLGNQRFSLEPLSRKTFSAASSEIVFFTGNGQQQLRYGVEAGTSRFFAGEEGWGFHKITSFDAVIDNRSGDAPFHYIVQGEHQVVAPHATQSHSSPYPLVIRFDRGDGSGTKQVVSNEQRATLTVGLNPQDNLWDLYAATPRLQTLQPAAASAAVPQVAPAF